MEKAHQFPSALICRFIIWSFNGFDKIIEFRNRLNCKNIHLILGNHDTHIEKNNADSW